MRRALKLIEFLSEQEGGTAEHGGDDGGGGGGGRSQGHGVVHGEPSCSVGMLAMHGYMQEFLEEFQYDVMQRPVDYCAWGHYYQKPTHDIVWTSMYFWQPSGT